MNHHAIVPARKNSQGFPGKNRIFFERKIKFLKKIKFFKSIIINTDDTFLIKKSKKYNLEIYKREKKLSGPNISIKQVCNDMIKKSNFSKSDYLWLFYIPLLYNNKKLLIKIEKMLKKKKFKSLCTFIKCKTHPYNTWKIKNDKPYKLINIDNFTRQSLPKIYEHYHHVCLFKISEINNLNSELIGKITFPYILDDNITEKLVEIDSPEDYKK